MHHTAPCGIPQLYTDGRGASERHRHAEQYQVGKEHTQNMESKHSHLRTRTTRLVRRTLCFSKTEDRHDLVDWTLHQPRRMGRPL